MASILNIGTRLEAVVDLCPNKKVIADIGCDHGYVTAELILQEKADMVIATEKSRSCLNKAILLADKLNITPFVSFREGDGFDALTKYDKVKCAIIAGMGGNEIISILQKKPKRLNEFILQPMKDTPMLRMYLMQHKFNILEDFLVKEKDKFYDVIHVTKGRCELSDLEIYFGKTNFEENYEVLYEYLNLRKKKLLDLKSKVGEMRRELEQELVYVEQALSLFVETDENKK